MPLVVATPCGASKRQQQGHDDGTTHVHRFDCAAVSHPLRMVDAATPAPGKATMSDYLGAVESSVNSYLADIEECERLEEQFWVRHQMLPDDADAEWREMNDLDEDELQARFGDDWETTLEAVEARRSEAVALGLL